MTWVVNTIRMQALKTREQDMNWKLLQISQRLIDLGNYGASIGDGMISDSEASSMPAAFQNRTLGFMYNSMQNAVPSANNKLDEYMALRNDMGPIYSNGANGNGTFGDGMTDAQWSEMCDSIYQGFLKTELEEYSKQETEKIHVEEKKIQQEKLQLETQLKAIQAEYEGISKAVDNDIKNSAIKLA